MPKTENFFIYGRKPVEEALSARSKQIDKIFVKNSISSNSYKKIYETAFTNHIPLVTVPEAKILSLVGRVNHQGFVALMSNITYSSFFDWIETQDLTKRVAVLLLDGIEDPHNLGAILRTAAAAGVNAVMVPTQNQAPVNATVFKTSAGTAGRIPIIRVHDTSQGFKDLKLAGFSIVGLDGLAENEIWEAEFENPIAFLIGNEGKGISKGLLKKCDQLIKFPMEHNVESLNASVSAALVSYEWKRRGLII
ncbi:MAG: 23S rRNA (guanosine(2251)-2'-O)-methyltransferase RlmB [Balneolaceae bacterium]|nr:23S rRNA (guanosine(2251)-2'-O)-methyltransferase RlmB [Balneolaceae bacterium]MBO6547887.1 23S rRNA (guanosine(2251)-2'-O)-methyltransferase RlmB [Balneolaceae bacterium]MBO6648400.1 23S rRNA (guanosine(2251)-2'-O)-methyltransferase RlmB [Balneolaceae bacterium]